MSMSISFIKKLIHPLKLMFLSLLLSGLFNFLVGPSYLLPNSLILMGIGLFFSGLTSVVSIVMHVPIMMTQAESMFPLNSKLASDY